MHDDLMQVLDDAVVRAVDVNAHLGYGPGGPPVEAGNGDGAEPGLTGPGEHANDVGRAARGGNRDEHVSGLRLGLKLVDEYALVADVVRYRGEQFHVRAEAQHLRAEVGGRPDALDMVALHVVRDRR